MTIWNVSSDCCGSHCVLHIGGDQFSPPIDHLDAEDRSAIHVPSILVPEGAIRVRLHISLRELSASEISKATASYLQTTSQEISPVLITKTERVFSSESRHLKKSKPDPQIESKRPTKANPDIASPSLSTSTLALTTAMTQMLAESQSQSLRMDNEAVFRLYCVANPGNLNEMWLTSLPFKLDEKSAQLEKTSLSCEGSRRPLFFCSSYSEEILNFVQLKDAPPELLVWINQEVTIISCESTDRTVDVELDRLKRLQDEPAPTPICHTEEELKEWRNGLIAARRSKQAQKVVDTNSKKQ